MISHEEYLKALSIIEEYKEQSKCKHNEGLDYRIDYNTYPYGETVEYNICRKCKTKINFKVK